MIKKQQFNLPDGAQGKNTYHFETSADKVIYKTQPLDEYLENFSSETSTTFIKMQPVKVSITIPESDWQFDSAETSDYKYFYEVEVADLTEDDIVEIFYSRESISTVLEAGICPSDNAPMAEKFRIYAADIPTSPIDVTYVIWKG